MRSARRAPAALVVAAAVLVGGCSDPTAGPRRTLDYYMGAIHAGDAERLAAFSAEYQDAARGATGEAARAAHEEFKRRTAGRLSAYEEAKKTGHLDLGPDGVGLVRGLQLGRGIFFLLRDVKAEGGTASLRMEVSTQYDLVPFENYPEGTKIFLMGMPVGRLLGPVRGEHRGEKIEVLAQIDLDWKFERALDPMHPTGWVVRSIRAVPGSERVGTVDWR